MPCPILSHIGTMRCVPSAQRETAILNLADENGSDEAVPSDRRDSRGLPETCERRDWRIRDPTWRKRDPTWRKSEKVCDKVNFVGEKKIIRTPSVHSSLRRQRAPAQAEGSPTSRPTALFFLIYDTATIFACQLLSFI